jgi:hypothetical protein
MEDRKGILNGLKTRFPIESDKWNLMPAISRGRNHPWTVAGINRRFTSEWGLFAIGNSFSIARFGCQTSRALARNQGKMTPFSKSNQSNLDEPEVHAVQIGATW